MVNKTVFLYQNYILPYIEDIGSIHLGKKNKFNVIGTIYSLNTGHFVII